MTDLNFLVEQLEHIYPATLQRSETADRLLAAEEALRLTREELERLERDASSWRLLTRYLLDRMHEAGIDRDLAKEGIDLMLVRPDEPERSQDEGAHLSGAGTSSLLIIQAKSTRPRTPTPQDDLEERFRTLATTWHAETDHLSSTTERVLHPSYQQIIGLGPSAVPFLLRDLAETRSHWFWALRAITGEDPVNQDDAGNIRKMTEAWLEWGRRKGYL